MRCNPWGVRPGPDLTCHEDSEVVWRLRRAGCRVSFWKDLVVQATDHRRLEGGRLRKTLHSMARCALLYTNLMPRKYRTYDWGYWQQRDGRECRPGFSNLHRSVISVELICQDAPLICGKIESRRDTDR
jgi:hypothetical protein